MTVIYKKAGNSASYNDQREKSPSAQPSSGDQHHQRVQHWHPKLEEKHLPCVLYLQWMSLVSSESDATWMTKEPVDGGKEEPSPGRAWENLEIYSKVLGSLEQ